jgi:hypothetical protein
VEALLVRERTGFPPARESQVWPVKALRKMNT